MVSLQARAEPSSLKLLTIGTHRTLAPADTIARAKPWLSRMGITRVANVTGLDRIGIPVAMAVRPNSRSVSVSQGKGQSKELAFASAIMEAAEIWHAEELGARIHFARRCDLAASGAKVVDPATLPGTGHCLPDDMPIGWIEGIDLLAETQCWVPAELVHTDYTLPAPPGSGFFLASTNGLASGNNLWEAISAACCEVVERDAVALWHARPPQARAGYRLDLGSVGDPGCAALLDRYAAAGMRVRVWNVTSDIGIPAFLCWIRETDTTAATLQHTSAGAGCHPDPTVALSRALTEAAQTRLNVIVGARDDLPTDYVVPAAAMVGPVILDVLGAGVPERCFDATAGMRSVDLAEDVRWELSQLHGAGIGRAVLVDLTHAEIGIAVARLIVPGLECDCHHPTYVAGPRARAAASAQ
jgi:YcaO-like protein with predicted kinase domain